MVEKVTSPAPGLLDTLLADEYILLTKTRNYFCHAFGSNGEEIHRLYKGQYAKLRDMVDEVADRIAKLGKPAAATLREFLEWTRLQQTTDSQFEASLRLRHVLADHETICGQLREDIKNMRGHAEADDPETMTMLCNFLATHEKMASTLRTYVQGSQAKGMPLSDAA